MWGMAGYANIVVRKLLNESSRIGITTPFITRSHWRSPSGQTNPAAGRCVIPAGSKDASVVVDCLFLAKLLLIITQAPGNHISRFKAIVNVRDLHFLRLFPRQLLVTQKIMLQTID